MFHITSVDRTYNSYSQLRLILQYYYFIEITSCAALILTVHEFYIWVEKLQKVCHVLVLERRKKITHSRVRKEIRGHMWGTELKDRKLIMMLRWMMQIVYSGTCFGRTRIPRNHVFLEQIVFPLTDSSLFLLKS